MHFIAKNYGGYYAEYLLRVRNGDRKSAFVREARTKNNLFHPAPEIRSVVKIPSPPEHHPGIL